MDAMQQQPTPNDQPNDGATQSPLTPNIHDLITRAINEDGQGLMAMMPQASEDLTISRADLVRIMGLLAAG